MKPLVYITVFTLIVGCSNTFEHIKNKNIHGTIEGAELHYSDFKHEGFVLFRLRIENNSEKGIPIIHNNLNEFSLKLDNNEIKFYSNIYRSFSGMCRDTISTNSRLVFYIEMPMSYKGETLGDYYLGNKNRLNKEYSIHSIDSFLPQITFIKEECFDIFCYYNGDILNVKSDTSLLFKTITEFD